MPTKRTELTLQRVLASRGTWTRETGPEGLQRAVTDLLSAERIFWLRMNSGNTFGTYKGKKWCKRGHEPGTADLLCSPLIGGFPVWLWLEVKAAEGKQTQLQVDFERRVTQLGHYYLLVRDPQQVIDWLRVYRAGNQEPF